MHKGFCPGDMQEQKGQPIRKGCEGNEIAATSHQAQPKHGHENVGSPLTVRRMDVVALILLFMPCSGSNT